jgi:DNA-binding LytR/AlgR family response regulator
VYFFSIRHHIYLVTLEETAELSAREYTLEKLEEQFSRSGFLRIHKSYLLNYRYVYHIGNDTVELTPHRLKKLPLSHRRSAAVRKRYQYFMRGEDDT